MTLDTICEIEEQRLLQQEELDQLKTQGERNRLGQFATPPALALEIAKCIRRRWRNRTALVRFLDPAIGTGSFYSALRQVFPIGRIETAMGVELDPVFAQAARRLWRSTELQVIHGDFTDIQPPERRGFNLVISNPPYVRHHHLPRDVKYRLQQDVFRQLGIRVSGLSGLYVYFMLLAHAWLEKDALSVWLIPSEFMDVNYGESLKEYLTRHVTLLQIHRFCPADVQFSDALVSSAVVIFKNRKPQLGHSPVFSLGGRLVTSDESKPMTLTRLSEARKWTQFPSCGVARQMPKVGTICLGDLFTVKRGLATGSNAFFIVPRSKLETLGVPSEFVKPILPSPRYLLDVIIKDADDGYPRIEKQLALIDCKLPAAQIRRQYPMFWSYLETGQARGIHEGYLASRRNPWYSQERRPPAPFLCTYMGRSTNGRKPFRFFWNQSQATAANVYLLLYPKPELLRVLKTTPKSFNVVFEFLQAITSEMFLNEGRVYGGGLYKLEPKELARIPANKIAEGMNLEEIQQTILFG